MPAACAFNFWGEGKTSPYLLGSAWPPDKPLNMVWLGVSQLLCCFLEEMGTLGIVIDPRGVK